MGVSQKKGLFLATLAAVAAVAFGSLALSGSVSFGQETDVPIFDPGDGEGTIVLPPAAPIVTTPTTPGTTAPSTGSGGTTSPSALPASGSGGYLEAGSTGIPAAVLFLGGIFVLTSAGAAAWVRAQSRS